MCELLNCILLIIATITVLGVIIVYTDIEYPRRYIKESIAKTSTSILEKLANKSQEAIK